MSPECKVWVCDGKECPHLHVIPETTLLEVMARHQGCPHSQWLSDVRQLSDHLKALLTRCAAAWQRDMQDGPTHLQAKIHPQAHQESLQRWHQIRKLNCL